VWYSNYRRRGGREVVEAAGARLADGIFRGTRCTSVACSSAGRGLARLRAGFGEGRAGLEARLAVS
jgi:hypothetical protein